MAAPVRGLRPVSSALGLTRIVTADSVLIRPAPARAGPRRIPDDRVHDSPLAVDRYTWLGCGVWMVEVDKLP